MGTKIKKKPCNLDLQIAAMKSYQPQFKVIKKTRTEIEFVGDIQVLPELPVYKLYILFRGNLRPHVKVLNPKLVENPPHFYKESETLCLYHPNNYRWTCEKLIAKDIVGWSAAWIFFYEAWLPEKKWYGPQADHSLEKKDNE